MVTQKAVARGKGGPYLGIPVYEWVKRFFLVEEMKETLQKKSSRKERNPSTRQPVKCHRPPQDGLADRATTRRTRAPWRRPAWNPICASKNAAPENVKAWGSVGPWLWRGSEGRPEPPRRNGLRSRLREPPTWRDHSPLRVRDMCGPCDVELLQKQRRSRRRNETRASCRWPTGRRGTQGGLPR